MILRIWSLICLLWLSPFAIADIAPEITWVVEGHSFVAKLPCLGCPFLYQDTSKGEREPRSKREDNNALLLNFSLPYDSSSITVNQAQIFPPTPKLERVYANQVFQDISPSDLETLITSNQIAASHEDHSSIHGAYFGLSYRYSIRQIPKSAALLFRFDVTELFSDLPEQSLRHSVDDLNQKMLEVILLPKPILSAYGPVTFEILRADLVPRLHAFSRHSQHAEMHFQDWDVFGEKGTPSHLLSTLGSWLLECLDSGVWAVFAFLLVVMVLFVAICLLCIFGCDCDWFSDDYEKAQMGKSRGERRRGRSGDLEIGKLQFKSPEELGLLGRGRVVGIGKSD